MAQNTTQRRASQELVTAVENSRNFLTGEDCVAMIARGPDYKWEELRLMASITYQENRTVIPHFAYDDVWFTSASPGSRVTSGSITFYKKAGNISPLHVTDEQRAKEQAAVHDALTSFVSSRVTSRTLLSGATAVDISNSRRSTDRVDWMNELDSMRAQDTKNRVGTSRMVATSATRGNKDIAEAVDRRKTNPGLTFSHIYDSSNNLAEPVDILLLLAYPTILDTEDKIFYGAISFRSVYFTGCASNVQNLSVEPMTESLSFIAQKVTRISLNQ